MTLEDFRRITVGLPDDAEFVDANGESCDYRISINQEYDTTDFNPRLAYCSIKISNEV